MVVTALVFIAVIRRDIRKSKEKLLEGVANLHLINSLRELSNYHRVSVSSLFWAADDSPCSLWKISITGREIPNVLQLFETYNLKFFITISSGNKTACALVNKNNSRIVDGKDYLSIESLTSTPMSFNTRSFAGISTRPEEIAIFLQGDLEAVCVNNCQINFYLEQPTNGLYPKLPSFHFRVTDPWIKKEEIEKQASG